MSHHILIALLALGCGASDSREVVQDSGSYAGTCSTEEGGRSVWVVNSLTFSRVDGDVSDGFDLDGDDSTTGGSTGCGIGDFVSPSGQRGIDNAFGRLMPALEATEFSAAEPLINDLIHSGELMMLGELAGLDAIDDDQCVGLALRRAKGVPLLGTDGEMLWGQTLEQDMSFADVEFPESVLVDGSVSGRPLTFTLPVQVLNAALEFPLKEGGLRVDLHDDGSASGVLAGGFDVQEVVETVEAQGIAQELKDLLRTALYAAADLEPDASGACTRVSVALSFTAIPAYIYEAP